MNISWISLNSLNSVLKWKASLKGWKIFSKDLNVHIKNMKDISAKYIHLHTCKKKKNKKASKPSNKTQKSKRFFLSEKNKLFRTSSFKKKKCQIHVLKWCVLSSHLISSSPKMLVLRIHFTIIGMLDFCTFGNI